MIEVREVIYTRSGDPYPCYKCREGVAYSDGNGDGICSACDERILRGIGPMGFSFLIRK